MPSRAAACLVQLDFQAKLTDNNLRRIKVNAFVFTIAIYAIFHGVGDQTSYRQ